MIKKDSKVTLKDIARELHLSPKAISSGLNHTGRLAPETRRKIQETARRMGYVPNAAARSLVTHNSRFIGVLIPYLDKSFFCKIIAGIEEIAGRQGFMLLLDSFDKGDEQKHAVISAMMQRDVDGVILYPREEDFCVAEEIRAMGVPVIQVMEYLPEFGEYAVTMDNFIAAQHAMEHLFERGHRQIGFIAHNPENYVQNERLRGYREAMIRHGLGSQILFRYAKASMEGGIEVASELFQANEKLTAIFSASDQAALGAIRTALSFGKRIPEDFAVVGFGDMELAANQAVYPLTTVAQPKEEVGRLAAGMLLSLLKGEAVQSPTLDAPLVVRRTS